MRSLVFNSPMVVMWFTIGGSVLLGCILTILVSVIFKNRPGDLTSVWEAIKAYDGNTKRPKFSFFIAMAMGTKPAGPTGSVYYHCGKCGEKLSESSQGGCPVCHNPAAEWKISKDPIPVTKCQSSCFDCSIYSTAILGPTCQDYGTSKYDGCNAKHECKCVMCCGFEFLRRDHPDRLIAGKTAANKDLPKPLSEAGKAFHDGRAGFNDINELLKWKDQKQRRGVA